MMGARGLRRATMVAIVVSELYRAPAIATALSRSCTRARTAWSRTRCIIDLRPIKAATGVTVDDVAKRLVDYGFHAPTMSFPVADTLMIEPTESENQREIDRFCDAMIAIRGEIRAIESGRMDRNDNTLKNAPHTHDMLLDPEWTHPYTKTDAFFPTAGAAEDKYWPPVARVDNTYGDRHLSCACVPIAAYAED